MKSTLSFVLHIQSESPEGESVLIRDGQSIPREDVPRSLGYLTGPCNRMFFDQGGVKLFARKRNVFIYGHLDNKDVYDRFIPFMFGVNANDPNEIISTLREAVSQCGKTISDARLSKIQIELESKVKKKTSQALSIIVLICLFLMSLIIWIAKK